MRRYFILVAFFFVVNVLNNYSLGWDVPIPLHMIFRSVSEALQVSRSPSKLVQSFPNTILAWEREHAGTKLPLPAER